MLRSPYRTFNLSRLRKTYNWDSRKVWTPVEEWKKSYSMKFLLPWDNYAFLLKKGIIQNHTALFWSKGKLPNLLGSMTALLQVSKSVPKLQLSALHAL